MGTKGKVIKKTKRLKIIDSSFLATYNRLQPISIEKHFDKMKHRYISPAMMRGYINSSAVFSSEIEGSPIDVDAYSKYKESGVKTESRFFKQLDDLVAAYDFAKGHKLTYENVLRSHKISTATILDFDPNKSGSIRTKPVYIKNMITDEVVYRGADPSIVDSEMKKLFNDIDTLLNKSMNISEVFYYASMIHLVFVNIHPFADGNGRTTRLIEKWFLVEKLGEKAWSIQSERLYKNRIRSYYKNIARLGNSYDTLNYAQSIEFLLMLPMTLTSKLFAGGII